MKLEAHVIICLEVFSSRKIHQLFPSPVTGALSHHYCIIHAHDVQRFNVFYYKLGLFGYGAEEDVPEKIVAIVAMRYILVHTLYTHPHDREEHRRYGSSYYYYLPTYLVG